MVMIKDLDAKCSQDDFELLEASVIAGMLLELEDGWEVREGKELEKVFDFDTYLEGASFAFQVSLLCEKMDHHARLLILERRVQVSIATEIVSGITKADFHLASKIEKLISLSDC